MAEKPVVKDEKTLVDSKKYDGLDASWEKETWVRIALKVFSCVRHQTAAIAILAIIALLWRIEARPQDTEILTFAMGFISMIAVSVEWIDSRHDDHKRRKGKTKSPHASENKGVN